jgi:hypothetical protein
MSALPCYHQSDLAVLGNYKTVRSRFTFSDVEKELQVEVRERNYLRACEPPLLLHSEPKKWQCSNP